MAGDSASVLRLIACVLALLIVLPTQADPFFVRVYGRTYKVDPRYASDEPKGPKPQEAMKALPSDIARGPGFRPSHDQVLAEVEERLWIARNQLDADLKETAASPEWRNTGVDAKAVKEEVTASLATGAAQSRWPELQTLYDRHGALNLLVRELRRSLDLPVRPPEAGFSRPKLLPEVEASYRDQKLDPLAAYDGYRRVKAAFRSGDVELLARVVHYPLLIAGKAKRTIRNRDQLAAAREKILDAQVREVVARSTFETLFVRDKGMMLGTGQVWITHSKTGFGLGAITVD
jgi:hypothetical protein